MVSSLVGVEVDGKMIKNYQAESEGMSGGGSSGGPVAVVVGGEPVLRGVVSTGMLDDKGKMRRGIAWLGGLELLVQVLELGE
ncbi:MAG: hypothetical protein G01um101416_1204 [Microgenomates group bacterium Gr01-1014_16]|nr:MAG: hypothetical protein G01um101416_1204 [Microgenomates group bacterium Gr01-1014_16]